MLYENKGDVLVIFHQFALVMDELMRYIQENMSWCMPFTNVIILTDKTCGGVNDWLDIWWQILKSKGLRLSRTKKQYLKCKFSDKSQETMVEVKIDSQGIPKKESFESLGL